MTGNECIWYAVHNIVSLFCLTAVSYYSVAHLIDCHVAAGCIRQQWLDKIDMRYDVLTAV